MASRYKLLEKCPYLKYSKEFFTWWWNKDLLWDGMWIALICQPLKSIFIIIIITIIITEVNITPWSMFTWLLALVSLISVLVCQLFNNMLLWVTIGMSGGISTTEICNGIVAKTTIAIAKNAFAIIVTAKVLHSILSIYIPSNYVNMLA